MTQEILTDEEILNIQRSLKEPFLKKYQKEQWQKALNTIDQLQRENAGMQALRIEQATHLGKAQEVIAVLRMELSKTKADLTSDGFCVDCHVHISEPADHLSHCSDRTWACDNTETLAKAYRQKLCDEIVEKIQTYSNSNLNNQENTAYAAASTIAFVRSIEFVKSVLETHQEPRPERFCNSPDLYGIIPLSGQSVDDWVAQKSTIDYSERVSDENNSD